MDSHIVEVDLQLSASCSFDDVITALREDPNMPVYHTWLCGNIGHIIECKEGTDAEPPKVVIDVYKYEDYEAIHSQPNTVSFPLEESTDEDNIKVVAIMLSPSGPPSH